MWVANYDRLPTRTRLASWGLQLQTNCCLCSLEPETRDHLLLTCQFSKDVWNQILSRLNPPSQLFWNWSELLSWIRASSPTSPSILRKLAVQATVFHLWRQRNNIYHNNCVMAPAVIANMVYRDVKNIILARRKRKQFWNLLSKWLL